MRKYGCDKKYNRELVYVRKFEKSTQKQPCYVYVLYLNTLPQVIITTHVFQNVIHILKLDTYYKFKKMLKYFNRQDGVEQVKNTFKRVDEQTKQKVVEFFL